EFDIIKRHALMGGNALKAIESQIKGKSFLAMGKEVAYNHHEKWDGSGYPQGLKGEAIPLSARIIALADVYDALTTKRFYKEAYSHDRARNIIMRLKGKHFDPEIVDAFAAVAEKFNHVRKEKLKGQADFSQRPARAVGR
ncbi:MAG: HD domain-containing protein, partial [Desulfobacterales bacterium]|nr:HD domain-containing protein [Desulfobacterales bacterium]